MSKPVGRGSQLSGDEKKEILRLHLLERLPISAIAKKLDRDRGSIRRLLNSDESKTMRQQLAGDERDKVMALLKANGVQVAHEWRRAIEVASSKGDHRAGLAWLLHGGLVDPLPSDAPNTRIAIVIGTDEHPMRIPSPLALLREEKDKGHGTK